jgi:hypothetical protein
MARGYTFHQTHPCRNVRDVIDFGIAARYDDILVPTCVDAHMQLGMPERSLEPRAQASMQKPTEPSWKRDTQSCIGVHGAFDETEAWPYF